jgi:hypothetical protein
MVIVAFKCRYVCNKLTPKLGALRKVVHIFLSIQLTKVFWFGSQCTTSWAGNSIVHMNFVLVLGNELFLHLGWLINGANWSIAACYWMF